MGPSDIVLVWRLRHGDHEACRDLIDRHHARVYGYLRRLGADGPEAEDLTQDTYARAWSRIGTLRRPVSLRSWLLTIARNEFLQRARSRRPEEIGIESVEDFAAAGPPADAAFARSEAETRLRRALPRLAATLREAIVLHYFQDLSFREVGAILGVPSGTAKSRVHRALVALRGLFEKEASHAG